MGATITDRSRGRPRQFDEDEVLDALMLLFNEHGFEGSSLTEIVEAAGLNKSSLYNAFGPKDELFRRVLDRYLDHRTEMLTAATAGDGGLEDLHTVFEFVRAEALSSTGQLGCLAINTIAELGAATPALAELSRRYRTMLRDHIRRPLERAAALGEIPDDRVDVYVDTAVSCLMATALIARSGASSDEVNHHVDSVQALIGTWRTRV